MPLTMFVTLRSPLVRLLGVMCSGLVLAAVGDAQSTAPLYTGHSIPGFPGFESCVRPPLGLSYENVTVSYTADKEKDRKGNNTGKHGSVQQFSNHSTLTWLSPWRILGANYVARARLSLTDSAPHPRSLDAVGDSFRLGDTYLEPLALYWRGDHGDLSLRYGLWMTTGSFDTTDQGGTGKGFKSHQISLGFTYYPDEAKLWNVSVLGRYGHHGKVKGLDVKPGDDIVLDWSAGRKLDERWNAGLVGYGVFQTSRDEGADANRSLGFYGTAGLGFGARYELPSIGGSAELRAYQEFNAYNHTEGQTGVFSLNFRI
jgi:hypothetical protein